VLVRRSVTLVEFLSNVAGGRITAHALLFICLIEVVGRAAVAHAAAFRTNSAETRLASGASRS